jgi:hypothetical protein
MWKRRSSSTAGLAIVIASVSLLPSCGAAVHARERRTGDWYALSTPHVRLRTDVGSTEARETVWALEDVHGALAHVFFGCRSAALDETTDVTMFARSEDYLAVAPAGTHGYFWPRESDLVVIEPRVVLPAPSGDGAVVQTYAHELTHRFREACLTNAPPWLDEGLARYFETLRPSHDGSLEGVPPVRFDRPVGSASSVDGVHVEHVDLAQLPSATTLLSLSREDFHALASPNDAAAWALVHMMLASGDDELRARFDRYLAALMDGATDPVIAQGALTSGLDLDARLAAYVRADAPRRLVPRVPDAIGEPITRRLEVAEVHIEWADLLARRGARSEARAHLELASRNPAFEVRALLLLARLSAGIERRDLVAHAEAIAPETREILGARAWMALDGDGAIEERIDVLRDLAALESPSVSELTRWADLARMNGDAQPAVAIAERAVRVGPTSWEAHAALALALASVHRLPESRAAFQRSLHLTSHQLEGIARQLERLLARIEGLMPQPPGDVPPEGALPPGTVLDVARQPIASVTGTTEATLDARAFGGACVGFVGRAPAAVFDVPADMPALAVYAHASGDSPEVRDTVLVLETSTGAVRCDDDSGGWPDPGIFAQLPPGRTRVWVGTYERDRAGTPFTLTLARHRTLGREPLPSVCGLAEGNGASFGPVVVGARVVLGRHTPVSGGEGDALHAVEASTNWMPEMESFVGREATVTQLEGEDGAGCPIVRVDADAGTWLWRVRDMSRPR